MNQCQYVKLDDTNCQAKPVKGYSHCFRHEPTLHEISIVASRKGGLNRRLQGEYGSYTPLNTPQDIQNFLAKVINDVWRGRAPVQVGTSMGFLTTCWLRAH